MDNKDGRETRWLGEWRCWQSGVLVIQIQVTEKEWQRHLKVGRYGSLLSWLCLNWRVKRAESWEIMCRRGGEHRQRTKWQFKEFMTERWCGPLRTIESWFRNDSSCSGERGVKSWREGGGGSRSITDQYSWGGNKAPLPTDGNTVEGIIQRVWCSVLITGYIWTPTCCWRRTNNSWGWLSPHFWLCWSMSSSAPLVVYRPVSEARDLVKFEISAVRPEQPWQTNPSPALMISQQIEVIHLKKWLNTSNGPDCK